MKVRLPTANDHRVARLAAKMLLAATRRGWRIAPWAPHFRVHACVPQPGINEATVDAASGLTFAWDSAAAGFFIAEDGRPAGVIYADWNADAAHTPAPGENGFHTWSVDDEGDLIGVMLAPRALV